MRYPLVKWLFAVFFLCLSFRAAAQATDEEVKTLIKQGVVLHDAGKYDEAVLRYKQALKLAPNDFTAQYELAMTYGNLGRHEEVVELCKKLLKDEARADANVYVTYGTALDNLKKPQEALRIYQTGIKKFPDNGLLHYNLGITQAGMERYDDAIASEQQAVRLNPRHASAHGALSTLTAGQSNRIAALLEVIRFLQLEPEGRRAEYHLARFDKMMGYGVKKTGENSVTINMSSDMLKQVNGKKGKSDNFGQADMLLTMTSALDYDDKSKDKAPTERLLEKLTSLCESLANQSAGNHPGFVWDYYVPYFVMLHKAGYLPTLVYQIQASRTGPANVQQWLDQHPSEVKELQEWAAAYKW